MKAYAQLEKYDELMVYLGRLDESLSQVDQVIKTGNLMADAILNSKLGLMKSRNIHTDVTVHVSEQMKTSDMDLCVLVGNLLDNAIEACDAVKEEENRFIRIYIDTLQNQLYISIMNGMEGTARRQGARFVSSKRGDRRQGFGLQQVDLQKSIGERGVGIACASAMLLDCKARGLDVHWDAQNPASRSLAEKMGYRLDCTYQAYSFMTPEEP